ncbi:hypothetical protein [Psychromonas aquimarina]|uniref:hypothetical protein n=1 Tax=Psychromonas aquimarina TaxID=444919 RepID=UPI00048E8363|nr:hypothetical protein [Psychromonas aquimarina]
MKNLLLIIMLNILILPSAFARDTIETYSLDDALSQQKAKQVLGGQVAFYFGEQPHGPVLTTFGEFKSNKKTNAFNKSDKQACEWVFLSAMISLQERAIKEGGNAVINIKSVYKNNLTSSNESFQCGAGTFIAGVALVGTVVKIAQ